MLRATALLLALPCAAAAQPALPFATEPCRAALAMTERATGVPDRLMQAIAVIESGRRLAGRAVPWPWTINVEGVGEVFETKQQAIAAVAAHQARGARSIDVGCMQVNLMHHAQAFASLDDAFDPAINARYAARFLQQLLAQTGSWPRAVAGYHSLTPDIGADYARKVLAVWAQPDSPRATPPQPFSAMSSAATPTLAVSLPPSALPSAHPAPATASTTPTMTRRGLDSYRAMPTALASVSAFRRL